jgi:peptidoglycan/LPS O-acetylase OafA/YrhL
MKSEYRARPVFLFSVMCRSSSRVPMPLRNRKRQPPREWRYAYHVIGSFVQIAMITVAAFYVVAWVRHHGDTAVGGFFKTPACRYLGRISYSLYLLHYPIVTLIAEHVAGFHHIHNISLRTLLVVALAGPPVFILSHLSYRFVERPFIERGKKIVRWCQNARAASQLETPV